MSIIADTLQRLQTQSNRKGPDTTDNLSLAIPTKRTREPGWHTPPSRLKCWLVGIGTVIGLSGLSLIAYWIGWNLNFGISTDTSPRNSQNISLSVSSPILNTPPLDSHSVESIPLAADDPVPDLPLSATQQSAGQHSIIHNAVTPEPPLSPGTESHLPSPLHLAVPISSELETRSIPPTSRHMLQRTISPKRSTPTSATAFSQEKEKTQAKTSSTGPPPTSSTSSDQPGPRVMEFDESDVTAPHIAKEVTLNKGPLTMEIFPPPVRQGMDDIPLIPNTTSMFPNTEEPPQITHPPIPDQLSPNNRLRHAQQLIQAGNYEKAVSMLSPLFEVPPVNWEPWFWMGTALLGQDHLEQAEQFFLSGLARNDKIPQLWIQRALVAHQRGAYQLAIHELQRAESLDAALPHTYLNLGYAYEKLGNNRLANEYYAKFLKLSEGNPMFFSTRKKLYARFTEQVPFSLSPGLFSSLPDSSHHIHQLSLP